MAVTKVINSEEKQFRPVLVDKVVLDAVPTVNSFNSVTSDGVARAIAGASGEVPVVTENDNGKVLKAVYDEGGPAVEWSNAVTVDQTYDGTSTNAQSGTAVAEAVGGVAAVPSVTSSDDGKVLKASYDSVGGTGSFSWETQTIPTVDQTYDSSSTNAQSGVAVAGALASVNQVPASTSSDANKVLTVDSQGVPGWATASGGGGDGIKQIYPQSVAVASGDGSLRVLNCNAFGLKYPAENNGFSFRILTYGSFSTDSIPMYGMYNDKMYMHGAKYITLATKYFYPLDGLYYAWFPCTGNITGSLTPISKDIYLKSKTTTVFSFVNISAYCYRSDGTLHTGTGSDEIKYRTTIKTPFSETPSLELYAEDFDLIGDWSTVSTLPKLEWTLAFMKSNGTWMSVNGDNTTHESSSALAASIPAGLSLALQSGSGLKLNPVTGLKVLNPLPSSTSTDEGKVLTVDSQGAAAWTATTPIQSVQALPANPDPNTLYVIPEA